MSEQLSSPDGPVTVSIGAAMLAGHASTDAWVHDADVCLYEAKRQGRDLGSVASVASGATPLMLSQVEIE